MNDHYFLIAVKLALEELAMRLESEYGSVFTTLEELIASGDMPDVYAEVLRRLTIKNKPPQNAR